MPASSGMKLAVTLLGATLGMLGGINMAHADKKTALEHYERGTTAYNLGRFEDAITEYQSAYESHPAPEFLFNIAQAYRQLDRCEPATFFYKRYLSLKPQAKSKKEVLGRIAELEARCQNKKALQDRPPSGTEAPSTDAQPGETSPPPASTDKTSPPKEPDATQKTKGQEPHGSAQLRDVQKPQRQNRIGAFVEGGLAFTEIGNLSVPAQFTLRMGASYRIPWGRFTLDPGVIFSLTPLPFEFDTKGTATMTSALANLTASYRIGLFRIRLDGGAGALLMFGLKEGNPLTVSGQSESVVVLVQLRTGLGVDFELTPSLLASLSPAVLSWSPTGNTFQEGLDSILRFETMAGLTYVF